MKKIVVTIMLVSLITPSFISAKQNSKVVKSNVQNISPEETQKAIKAAMEWLSLVDSKKYAESWTDAASFFKSAMPQDRWITTLSGLLPAFGNVVKRKILSSKYYTELPGAPDGKYIVIQIETSFKNKKNSIETITPMKDGGVWKVSGYFIK